MWEKTMFPSEDGRPRIWELAYFTEIKFFFIKIKNKN